MKFNLKRNNKPKESNSIIVKMCLVLFSLFLFLYCVSLLLPLIWMLITSLKDEINYTIDNIGLPETYRFRNYVDVLTKYLHVDIGNMRYGVDTMFFNSIVLTTGTSFMVVFTTLLCAYALARFDFIGNKLIYTTGIVFMILPVVGTFPASFMLRKKLGLYDNMFPHILASGGGFSGTFFLVMYAAFKGIPKDFSEAAELDGAGNYRIFFTIMFPIMLPTATTMFVLNFMSAWNDYETPLMLLPSYPNLPFGMYAFQKGATAGGDGAGTTVIMAGFVIVMIPTILIYIFSQKLMNSNFVIGGIKG